METSNAFLRKACMISMMILGKFRLLFCKFLIFVSEWACLLCQVSEISISSFFWIWENICWSEKIFLNNCLTFLISELISWIVAYVFFGVFIRFQHYDLNNNSGINMSVVQIFDFILMIFESSWKFYEKPVRLQLRCFN